MYQWNKMICSTHKPANSKGEQSGFSPSKIRILDIILGFLLKMNRRCTNILNTPHLCNLIMGWFIHLIRLKAYHEHIQILHWVNTDFNHVGTGQRSRNCQQLNKNCSQLSRNYQNGVEAMNNCVEAVNKMETGKNVLQLSIE